ncbi:MAG TPA: hypothetical protein VK923_05670 [Euzebyales bacterium]|nr:hypothetical protein [Euzebyales bacterium]
MQKQAGWELGGHRRSAWWRRAAVLVGGLPDAVELGRSLLFLPAPPDGVWIVTGDSWGPGGSMRVRHVDLAGARRVAPTPVPAGTTPVAAQGDRVLLEGDDALRWWTPSTGDMRRIPGRRGLAAGQTTTVVCDARCRTVDVLHRDGTRGARLRMTEPVVAAALAPDERAIALLTDSELATAAVVIVDRDAGAMQSVTNGVASRLAARG